MKIIGKGENGEYLCQVSHSEIEKCFDKYFNKDGLTKLEVGQTIDIGAGYNFRNQIKDLCEKVIAADKAYSGSRKTLIDFALMISKQESL